ncbi:MAG: PadR family transcriptional regulator [Chloroflexota bacterium]
MTDAELTILSLIAEGPRYGHEVQRVIDERGLREWLTVGFSSVYYILNRLEEQNLLTSEMRSVARTPARKVYSITEAGRGVLQTAVAELLRQPRALGTGFELGLANLFVLKPRQVYRVMSQHRAELEQRLVAVEASWQRQQSSGETVAEHIQALFTHSIALMRAELAWFDVFLSDWRARYPAVEKEDTRPPAASQGAATSPDDLAEPTQHHRFTTSPDKMIQRLKRLPPVEPSSDTSPMEE